MKPDSSCRPATTNRWRTESYLYCVIRKKRTRWVSGDGRLSKQIFHRRRYCETPKRFTKDCWQVLSGPRVVLLAKRRGEGHPPHPRDYFAGPINLVKEAFPRKKHWSTRISSGWISSGWGRRACPRSLIASTPSACASSWWRRRSTFLAGRQFRQRD